MKQDSNSLLVKVLTVIFFIFIILIVARYYVGLKILKENEKRLDQLAEDYISSQSSLDQPLNQLSDPKLGIASADNMIYLFSEFECPYCAQAFNNLIKLYNSYPNEVVLIWKDAASNLKPEATRAAVAARCAQSQNRFWDYASYLFSNQEDLSDDLYLKIAQQLNLNTDEFGQCLENQVTLPLVTNNLNEALSLNIESTPHLFFNGQSLVAPGTYEDLEKMLK